MLQKQNKQRESNFELLRILAILFVIADHYYMFYGGLEHAASDAIADVLSQSSFALARTCVNLFLMISGYFMVKGGTLRWGKVLTLLILVVFYQSMIENWTLYTQGRLEWGHVFINLIPASYFINIYCAVYILSPLLNKAVGFERKTTARMLLLAVFMFCLWPNIVDTMSWRWGIKTMGTYATSLWGKDGGLTFLNFTICYVTGAYMRLYKPLARIPLAWRITAIFAIALVLGGIGARTPGFILTDAFTGYDSVINLALSVLIFSVFEDMRIGCSVMVNTMAKATLVVYLVSNFVIEHIMDIGYYARIPEGGVGNVLCSWGCIVATWLLSALIYFAMTAVFAPVIRRWKHSRLYNKAIYG